MIGNEVKEKVSGTSQVALDASRRRRTVVEELKSTSGSVRQMWQMVSQMTSVHSRYRCRRTCRTTLGS